jgi:hypothetical protein
MKQFVVLLGCVVLLSGMSGCQNENKDADVQKEDQGVEVIVVGGGEFPRSFAGTWRPDNAGWEFVFEPDGNISSAVIDNGLLRVNPNERVTTIPLIDDGVGTYELGKWVVQYTPMNRELSVEVVVDHFHLDMKTYGMMGHITELFVGPVSEDSKVWKAQWFTFPTVITLMPEPYELPFDPNSNPKETFFFIKQTEEN